MGEQDEFIIIDEKPKRRQGKPKREPQKAKRQKSSAVLLVALLTVIFVLGLVIVVLLALIPSDGSAPTSLELQATSLVATNDWIVQMLTETAQFPTPTVSFQWASQELPEITTVVQEAFSQVDILQNVSVRVIAYGENCFNCNGRDVVFGAMNTDVYLTMELDSLGDSETLAQVILAADNVIRSPSMVEFPAPLGYFDMTLHVGETDHNLRATFEDIAAARTLSGAAFLAALGGIH